MKYWIASVSKDHVLRWKSEGIMQVCHGKKTPLTRIKAGDKVLFYSWKDSFPNGNIYQKFTALAQALDDDIYQFQISEDFCPFRRKVHFLDFPEKEIRPLLENLSFITDIKHWGYPFRFGLFEISQKDFENIVSSKLT